jgi:ATP-dependent helicase/nuclease subunit B
MPIERTFLGWTKPCLHEATTWLCDRIGPLQQTWDLSPLLVVLPGARAVRRLRELLVQEAQRRRWVLRPATIVTQGQLPERLYTLDHPEAAVADDWSMSLAWLAALRGVDEQDAGVLAPLPPAADDTAGWLAAAEELAAVVRELAGDGLLPGDVLDKLGGAADFPDLQRWQALQRLHERYEAILQDQGLIDRDSARRQAVPQCDQHVVLIGCVDLPGVAAAMLRQLASPVDALIHAPQSHQDDFDDVGVLLTQAWSGRAVTIADEQLSVVDAPRDQAQQVVRELERHGSSFAADQITVGLGDEAQAGAIARTLELAGLPARSAIGMPLAVSAPLRLLMALGRFVGSRRFDDLAALLRHPDIEAFVNHTQGVARWLTLLDRYANDHLQRRLTGTWLGDDQMQASLKRVHDAVVGLLPFDADERRPLPMWAAPIADALAAVYGGRTLHRHDAHDRRVIEALDQIGEALRSVSSLNADAATTPGVTVAEAVRLIASSLEAAVLPQPGGEPAIELLGWLELAMDDAPLMLITGVNEGHIPHSRGSDPWLPDSARARLGLADDRRRLARDTLLLTTILHSRPHLHLIACRRSAEGDPVPPSRLLLACDAPTRARRLLAFYDEAPPTTAKAAPLLLLTPGRSRFTIPMPPKDVPPLDGLSVTAFADYIACPYRFYLKHVLKLQAIDDQAIEMGGDVFGDLAHGVLDDFGEDAAAGTQDIGAAVEAIDRLLDKHMTERFGDTPAAAVLIQCRLLRERLHALARWHTRELSDGWRILHIEQVLSLELIVDGQPFTLRGRIDRIDVRDTDGRHRILDYKTSDQPRQPDEVHRIGLGAAPEWVSLQLPLYRKLVEKLGIFDNVELGYVLLPRAARSTGYAMAPWTEEELLEAQDRAVEIIRAIRRGEFWPPKAPQFADDYAGICLEDTLDRPEVLKRLLREGDAS